MEFLTSRLRTHRERVTAQISGLTDQVNTVRADGGISAELAALYPPPAMPVSQPWEASLSALLGREPRVPPPAVRAIKLIDRRLGALRIGPDSLGFDDEDIEWDKIVELRTRRLSDVLTGSTLDDEVDRISGYLPTVPGRKWVLGKLTDLLAALSLAALGDEIDKLASALDGTDAPEGERQVVSEIVYRGWVNKNKEVPAGLFIVTCLAQLPGADEAIRELASCRGIPVVGASEDVSYQEAMEGAEALRSRFTAIAGRVGRKDGRDELEDAAGDADAERSAADGVQIDEVDAGEVPGGSDATSNEEAARALVTTEVAEGVLRLARSAGAAILAVAGGADPHTRTKADASPVTVADIRAETLIVAGLASLTPQVPIVAEEQVAAGEVPDVSGDLFWLVDPLDGTKEFISGNGEYTVNIALVAAGEPILGIVYLPALDTAYVGGPDGAVIRDADGVRALKVRQVGSDGFDILVSRSHLDPDTESWLAAIPVQDRVSAGSSLKFCRIAEGRADLYPRFGRTMEWDTAAGDAVVRAAGGMVRSADGAELEYGKDGFENPPFIAHGGTPPPTYAG